MVGLLPPHVETALEPTPGKGNLVRALTARGIVVTAPEDFRVLEDGEWDAVVMNPPFSPPLIGYEILFRCMEMTDIVVALMPWLVIINSEKRTKAIFEWGLKSVTHLPRNTFPGCRAQCCILEMVRGYSGDVRFGRIVR